MCTKQRKTEPGTDPGFSKRQPRDRFEGEAQKQIYHWIDRCWVGRSITQEPPGAGFVTQLSDEDAGLSRAQVTRYRSYEEADRLQPRPTASLFLRSAILAPIELLATVDGPTRT